MDARAWTGDDDRDLDHDTELDDCADCGARWNEPCDPGCPCAYCVGKRAREAARRIAETVDA